MANEQKKIAFLVSAEGIEQVELTDPWHEVEKAGGVPRLLSTSLGQVKGFNHLTPADEFPVDVPFAEADPADYDGVVIPGGVANSDLVRTDEDAVRFVQAFARAGKPIASICHGPWLLAEADVLKGKKLTSYPSIRTDLRNAGADWSDEEVRVCDHNGWTLVTSRNPDDLPAFNKAALKAFGL
ncbi:type 1 glutamine amidotransferase [Actinosynnema pretiosum subsp. pretiosum]|uniref:Intracellular protease, PfpI family n=2 Tax=Actinosynnema TaxID=40566 RepID=C6WPL6_ACTMD|nr:type 1 glutamine amidotransferase domain-containing protein [Actinosynnema mirum]ACU40567.1 intracellular protease, PfpI family [Actinosynnema mirum DSM 43827]AXX34079.1 ThiJ/PfpI family protein [Actinosynnema pretiosum subsp. pretiosum]QUF02188.1 type 1 glutamine amidotransferase [Actinosynnema pretiosum subsp. pretiosum]